MLMILLIWKNPSTGADNSTHMNNLKQPRNEIDFGGEEVALLPSFPFSLTDTCQSYI